jgi:glycosyltransferase involved in cell wall biosynthesis
MAMGRPIITTDAPGCRETVVEGANGLLVPVGDALSLYAAMKRFVLDPSLCGPMGAESRQMVERRYDARKVAADVLRHAGL